MSTLRGGPGLGALLTLARHAAGAPPAVLRRGGIATAIGLAAQRSPDQPVLVREHDSLTGRELDSALRATAAAIAERFPRGSRIALRGDGGIAFVVALAAAGLAGVDAVAAGPRTGALRQLAGIDGGVTEVDAWELFVRPDADVPAWRGRGTGRVQLLSTGTTGAPVATARGRLGLRAMLQLADADRRLGRLPGPVLVLAPPDHGHGLSMVLAGLVRGRRVVLASGQRPAEQEEAAARHRVRTISGVPAQLARLEDSAYDGVELVVSGSSRLDPALRARLERNGARVLDCYGSTESGTVAIEGRPLAGVTIEVGSDHRIRLSSPLGGRRRDPGDTGRIEHGRLIVEGRAGALVDSGGELVSPARVEAELRAVPGVACARVWAEPDDLLGSRLCADIVVSESALDAAALTRHLTERLGRAAVPRTLVVSPE
jgi:acyl-CoA synthetase (AMP-forming)/AMP-acid ligase II